MNYNTLAPGGTFLGAYMEMCSVLETPLSYDAWCGIWALGTALGRSVYVPRPHSPVYMNWYVLLAAESGVTRKSTAVRMARDIVRRVLDAEQLVEGRETPEHLFEVLARAPHIAIAVSELVTFLGRESYVIELPALLTDLYDCPTERRGGTIARGTQVIRNPYVSFISASTPSWLLTAVNPSVIEGGFTSRTMFIYDEKPKQRVPWPTSDSDIQGVVDLLHDTVRRAREVGRIDLLPAAMQRYSLWYKRRDTVTDMPFLSSFLAREDAHVLRFAACLCINDGVLAIERRHIDYAIKAITDVKAGALQVFSARGTAVRIAQGVEKMTRILFESGGVGVPHTPLYTAVRHYMSATDFGIVIEMMRELDMVIVAVENKRKTSGGRRGKRYFRTDKTLHGSSLAALREAVA